MNNIRLPYELVFVYDDGEQFTAGKYLSLKDALIAKAKAQQENNAPDITGRTVVSITILKGE